jgi:hypothetical protein
MITFPATISGLSNNEQQLYRRLLKRLYDKRRRNQLRSQYRNGRNQLHDIGYSLPPIAKDIDIVIGWPEKAIEALANRVRLDGMIMQDGSALPDSVDTIMDQNDLIQMAQSVHADAFTHSCSFVAVLTGNKSAGEPDAIIQEFTADTATGEWDKRRKRLKTALLFDTDDDGDTVTGIYLMTSEETIGIIPDNGWHSAQRDPVKDGNIPCELFAFKPDATRPFGRSRIDRTVMSLTDSAVRTFLRGEIQAELYSVPGRYFLGVTDDMFADENGNPQPMWKIMLDQVLALPSNSDGEKPTVGQFQQASFEPHLAQLRQTATMFASATSMTPDAMGVLTSNPSSADAIDKANKELCLLAEECQNWFAKPWQNVIAHALTAARKNGDTGIRAQWRNPSTPSKSASADLALKLVQGGILPPDSDVTYDLIDLSDQQRRILRAEQKRQRSQQLVDAIKTKTLNPPPETQPDGTADNPASTTAPAPPQQ